MKLPVIRKLPSGSWHCRLRVDGRDVSITDPDRNVVEAKVRALKTGVLQIRREPSRILLGDACDAYNAARRGVRSPTTVATYEKYRRLYFQSLMKVPIGRLTERDFSRAVSLERQRVPRRGDQLSAKTLASVLGYFRGVLREHGIVLGRITAPEVKRRIVRLPDPAAVLRAVRGTDIELPCLLAAWLSLSMSEIRGLTRSSVRDGKLYVTDTLVTVRTGTVALPDGTLRGVYEDIKKEGGKEELRTRAFDLPPYLASLIGAVPGDVLVPLSIRQIERRFDLILRSAGLPHMTFHQLRHMNASIMAMLGIQKEIAQERGGWKSPYTMDQVYTHTFAAPRLAADQTIDAWFSSALGLPQNGNKTATPSKSPHKYRLKRNI